MNKELFINALLWIATLAACLQAMPTPSPGCPPAPVFSDSRLSHMGKTVTCVENSTFYAPENVKNECITAALECVMSELDGVAKWSCEDPQGYIDQELDFLDSLLCNLKTQHEVKSSECPCELWSETPLTEFLRKTQSLYQQINAASRPH